MTCQAQCEAFSDMLPLICTTALHFMDGKLRYKDDVQGHEGKKYRSGNMKPPVCGSEVSVISSVPHRMFPEATFPWFSVLSRAHCTSSHFPSKIAGHHSLLHHVTCDLTMVQNVWNQAFLGNSLMKDHYKQRASTTHLPEHVTFLPDVWPGAKSSKLFPIY